MWFWFFLFSAILTQTPTPIVDDTHFTCANLTVTSLANNSAAIDLVRTACQNDAQCNIQFATEYLGDSDAFVKLLQLVIPFMFPLNVESPVQEILCDKDLQTVVQKLWADRLVLALDEVFPCTPGERFTLIKNGTEGKCVSKIENTLYSVQSEHSLRWGLMVLILIIVFADFIVRIYQVVDLRRRDRKMD